MAYRVDVWCSRHQHGRYDGQHTLRHIQSALWHHDADEDNALFDGGVGSGGGGGGGGGGPHLLSDGHQRVSNNDDASLLARKFEFYLKFMERAPATFMKKVPQPIHPSTFINWNFRQISSSFSSLTQIHLSRLSLTSLVGLIIPPFFRVECDLS